MGGDSGDGAEDPSGDGQRAARTASGLTWADTIVRAADLMVPSPCEGDRIVVALEMAIERCRAAYRAALYAELPMVSADAVVEQAEMRLVTPAEDLTTDTTVETFPWKDEDAVRRAEAIIRSRR